MRLDLVPLLACPDDAGQLLLATDDNGPEIEEGSLGCISGDHEFSIRDGIPDFRTQDWDWVIEDQTEDFGTIPTKAVARLLSSLRGNWSVDAGCARAAYHEFVPGRYVGVDVVRAFLLDAKRAFPAGDFIAADIRRLPFADGVFDIALCSQVVEHIHEDELNEAVGELRRVSYGTVLVDTPNDSLFFTMLRRVIYGRPECHEADSPMLHHVKFNTARLRHLGFEVEGCIGHVSRRRFRAERAWDAFDKVAQRLPWIGGNLIGRFDHTTQHR